MSLAKLDDRNLFRVLYVTLPPENALSGAPRVATEKPPAPPKKKKEKNTRQTASFTPDTAHRLKIREMRACHHSTPLRVAVDHGGTVLDYPLNTTSSKIESLLGEVMIRGSSCTRVRLMQVQPAGVWVRVISGVVGAGNTHLCLQTSLPLERSNHA